MSGPAHVRPCSAGVQICPVVVPTGLLRARPHGIPAHSPSIHMLIHSPDSPAGAFGPAEDAVFRAATEWALEERLPVVYLAANSGARVGLANEVKQCLQVGAAGWG